MSGADFLGIAANPATKTCDSCGAPGVKALEIFKTTGKKVGTGQFLYPCSRHIRLAEESLEAVKAPISKKKHPLPTQP